MFTSVLIANRGEIAVRICRTLRSMGVRSVVVASIPDRRSLAVRSADAWVLLEGYSAAESYLDVDAVIAAAKAEGCDAIHPGYGFLSERADFAERCIAEGITFIGPPPAVLRGMGDKAAARQLAVANGVPVVPGWDGADDAGTLTREAARIGFPVMLKARGGGGGRGMREVFVAAELADSIESARREAIAAFGDGGLLLEKLVTNAHHVEVQVLADTHGNVIHLGERDCSVQRRHQKLIEESPSPVVDDALRERLTGYALKLARAINYVNAGTFEFLVTSPTDPSPLHGEGSNFTEQAVYFLEVNPRLQVEHPVTEMVTGLDLVELQLRIAAGEPLPMRQEDVKFEGHAIEFRINAEDPWDGFKPSSGRIENETFSDEGLRGLHAGYGTGDYVPTNYDSLLGKLVAFGGTRQEAVEQGRSRLWGQRVDGISSNLALLSSIVGSRAFAAGECSVAWLESSLVEILESALTPGEMWAVAGATIMSYWDAHSRLQGSAIVVPTVWLSDGASVRCVQSSADSGRMWQVDSAPFDVELRQQRSQFEADVSGHSFLSWPSQDEEFAVDVELDGGVNHRKFRVVPPPSLPRRAHAATAGAMPITAPLSGTIAAVRVAEGDAVVEGQLLALLEAMKMEHRITAPTAGVVKAVNVRERDTVREGDVLVELV